MVKIIRGFTIRAHRAGDPSYEDQKIDTWAEKGSTPAEWDEVKGNPEVDKAVLYTSAQRRVRADKRRYVETYTSEETSSLTYYRDCAFCAKECQGH